MLVTAKTAERMVCPMGLADGWSKSTCYGPECMGWRWAEDIPRFSSVDCKDAHRFAQQEPERPENVPSTWPFVPGDQEEGLPSGWREPGEVVMMRRRGYCGMAGKPGVE